MTIFDPYFFPWPFEKIDNIDKFPPHQRTVLYFLCIAAHLLPAIHKRTSKTNWPRPLAQLISVVGGYSLTVGVKRNTRLWLLHYQIRVTTLHTFTGVSRLISVATELHYLFNFYNAKCLLQFQQTKIILSA